MGGSTLTKPSEAPPATPPASPPANPPAPVSYTRESLADVSVLDLIGDEALKKDPSLASFKGVESIARSYASARKMLGAEPGAFIKVPTDATPPEELEKFYNTLGRPETSDKYVVPEGVAANQEKLMITADTLKEFGDVAHKLGLSNRQFQAVIDWYAGAEGFVAKTQANALTEFEATIGESTAKLQGEWGEKYDANIEMAKAAQRAIAKQDETIVDLLETPFLVGKGRLGDDPRMIRLFARIGAGLREDELKDGRAGSGTSFESKRTPAEAQAEIKQLEADPEFSKRWKDANNPAHKDAVARMQRLYEQAFPG